MTRLYVFNYTSYQNIIYIILAKGFYNSGKLQCNSTSENVAETDLTSNVLIYGISPDGNYLGKATYEYDESSFASIIFTINGNVYDCDGNNEPADSLNISHSHMFIDLQPVSDSALSDSITFNGDKSVTINGVTYEIEKVTDSPDAQNITNNTVLYIIIIFLVIILVVAIAYIIIINKSSFNNIFSKFKL